MYLVCLEVAQQVVNHLGFRHEVGGTDQGLPPEALGFAKVGQEVLDVEHALDVVLRVLIDRDAAVVVGYDARQHVAERRFYVEVHDVHAAGHDFLGHLTAKAYDALQHVAFLGYVLLVCQLHRLFQVVHSEHFFLVVGKSLCDDFAANEQAAEGPEGLAQHLQGGGGEAAEGEGVLPAVYLGDNLAEEQQQEGEQHRHHDELQPFCLSEFDGLVEAEIEDDDNGHVYQVVADEDSGKQAFAVAQEGCHSPVSRVFLLVNGESVARFQAEECNLACRDEARAKQQYQDDTQCYPYAQCGFVEADPLQLLLK